jgi:uncharacterized protein YjbJ (UPF0337 family)
MPSLRLTAGPTKNKDRIAGAVKEIKGSVEGKIQNAIGGLKDTLKN